jgi:hypothetical protein
VEAKCGPPAAFPQAFSTQTPPCGTHLGVGGEKQESGKHGARENPAEPCSSVSCTGKNGENGYFIQSKRQPMKSHYVTEERNYGESILLCPQRVAGTRLHAAEV